MLYLFYVIQLGEEIFPNFTRPQTNDKYTGELASGCNDM